jgi:hypothetical protein
MNEEIFTETLVSITKAEDGNYLSHGEEPEISYFLMYLIVTNELGD